ncbi:MAG: hypothetical protein KM312_10705 [Hydrogenibacillus schlegelii]|uniref:Uncharacterized protein n=1 Tax=Hydrogenibacillus schlegelii TaxID=1484 RepID=A0A947GCF2_HYDSH|nr:hypothetical protein [Hydrogenibacillus schlegelii]
MQRMIRQVRSYLDRAATRLYADVYLLPARVKARVGSVLRNDRGGVSLEWVALGFLVLAILFAVATAFSQDKGGIGQNLAESVKSALSGLFNSVAQKANGGQGGGGGQ